jgi:hypothetical protein
MSKTITYWDEELSCMVTGEALTSLLEDAKRYRWLKEHVFEVLCEGRPADCNAKWMLPRLVAEDSTGRKFTFDEIIDIQMKRSGE